MKRLILALPLAIFCAGCPSNEDATVETTAPDATTSVAPTEEATPDEAATATPVAEYRVVDAAGQGLPQPAVDALTKAKVPPPAPDMEVPDTARVRLQTSQGPITIELNGKVAPLHVKSFLHLAERGFYNGTQFHRYEPDFVIQGGDPLTKNEATREFAGVGGPGYNVPREKNELAHEAMVIAAARSADPDSAGSQFYFTLKPAGFLDQGDGYTVFGKVVDGEANVLKLRKDDTLENVTVLTGPANPASN